MKFRKIIMELVEEYGLSVNRKMNFSSSKSQINKEEDVYLYCYDEAEPLNNSINMGLNTRILLMDLLSESLSEIPLNMANIIAHIHQESNINGKTGDFNISQLIKMSIVTLIGAEKYFVTKEIRQEECVVLPLRFPQGFKTLPYSHIV